MPMSVSLSRRLSARRGSNTAPDPHGVHNDLNLNPNRSSSSKLTIVRVLAPHPVTPLHLTDPPASPQRRFHRKAQQAQPERVSFASSSFGGHQRSQSPDQHSPSSSPRLRPSSPHAISASFKPRLSPDQLLDLARQSTVPRPAPLSPAVADVVGYTAPATFTPLPADIYLPFIDRPSEVATLISSPPDVKLFTLLAQTFPKNVQSQLEQIQSLPRDPARWSFQQLVYHLTHVDRDAAPDFIWSIAARKCILSHSELLWERIKGALGVPPELDVDYNFLDDDQDSPDTSDISDDEGRAARGHWSDWDEVVDSPIYARGSKRYSMECPAVDLDGRLQGLKDEPYVQAEHNQDEVGEDTITAPTPHGISSPSDHDGLVIGHFSPPPDHNPDYLSIEPLLASRPSSGDGLGDIAEDEEEGDAASTTEVAASATSVASSDSGKDADGESDLISPSQIQGLQISTSPLPANGIGGTPVMSPISPRLSFQGISPSAIVDTTSPQPVHASYASSSGSRSHSRAGSFSGSIGPFQRNESTGNLSASWSAALASANSSGYASSVIGSDAGDSSYGGSLGGYMSDGDRLPGKPLFPSNFSRLAGAPTLSATQQRARNLTRGARRPHARLGYNYKQEVEVSQKTVGGITIGGPSLANRAGRVRKYSHGASTLRKGSEGEEGNMNKK